MNKKSAGWWATSSADTINSYMSGLSSGSVATGASRNLHSSGIPSAGFFATGSADAIDSYF